MKSKQNSMVWYIHSVYYTLYSKISLKNFFQHFFQRNGPGPLNITFGSDIPITVLHLMLMSKICVVNSYMKNVIGISDPSECDVQRTRSPGPLVKIKCDHNLMKCNWKKKQSYSTSYVVGITYVLRNHIKDYGNNFSPYRLLQLM